MKKIQLPAIGGFRKVIYPGGQASVGTTIAEVGSGTITLSQLAAAINNILQGSGTTTTGSAQAADLVVGPGLTGGGTLVGKVPLRLTAPIPWFGDAEQGDEGERGPPGIQGPSGLQGIPGQFLMPEDGADGDWGPPGAAGAVGATGPQGPQGPAGSGTGSGGTGTLMMFVPEDASYDDLLPIPGAVGPRGPQGLPGYGLVPEDPYWEEEIFKGLPGGPITQSGVVTLTLTGITTTVTTPCAYAVCGAVVVLSIAGISAAFGTSNSTSLTLTGLPSFLQPQTQFPLVSCNVVDNALNVMAVAEVQPGSNTITFFRAVVAGTAVVYSATGFTATGNKGVSDTCFSYNLV